jgi:leucyl aminopeptidase
MDFAISTAALESINTDCLVLGLYRNHTLTANGKLLDKLSKGQLVRHVKREAMSGQLENTRWVHDLPGMSAPNLLLAGLGDADTPLTLRQVQKWLTSIDKALADSGCTSAVIDLSDLLHEKLSRDVLLQQAALLLSNRRYQFTEFKKSEAPAYPVKKIQFHLPVSKTPSKSSGKKISDKQALAYGKAIASGMTLTKNLGNMPPNICNPSYLAKQAQALSRKIPALTCKVFTQANLKEMGAHAFLAVAQGSKQQGALVQLNYRGSKNRTEAPIVLVGKGITFDTGGISIKPAANMDEMKYDMCGAGTVLGVMQAIAELKLPINVIGMLAAAENMPSGHATRPGDIVTTLSGKTVEILNTDAEGRLVLCDTLTYVERFKPKAVIDIATLTGACIVALGHHTSAVLGNDEALISDLLKASQHIDDKIWQLPLGDDYAEQLKSPFADMANIGPGGAGTITAAAFLSHYTKNYKWAHLDIAGTAWVSGGTNKGATGRPVPLLTQYLIDQCA